MANQKMAEAYPLQWPDGWKRTEPYRRGTPRFKGTFASARDGLLGEIRKFGGSMIVLSTNIPLRLDGLPYSSARSPDDPGVAVYFQRKGKAVSLACDKWRSVTENIRALELTLEAMRGIDRWGSSELMERTFTGFTALPAPESASMKPWESVLGLAGCRDLGTVRKRRNELVRKYHPDFGEEASHDKMAEVNRAFESAESELTQ